MEVASGRLGYPSPMRSRPTSTILTRQADPPSWTVRRDRGETTFATDPLMRTIMANMIALLDNFVEKGSLSDGYNEEQRDFFNEHAATWMMGCWMSGDVEPLQVNFEIEYWPIPSMTGHQPLFINTSNQQRGWAMTSSAQGAYYEKSLAVLNAYYYPAVYQAYLNARGHAAQRHPSRRRRWPQKYLGADPAPLRAHEHQPRPLGLDARLLHLD